ncbi:MAG TPA: GntR family transcriptional regulator [Bryobacteraceae bacterium]|jgi:GntR family transcriptional regulator|nr:GntR family transcriptional regulator [Bryobacteraceae bacterium]
MPGHPNRSQPVYRRIQRAIQRQIERGKLKPGDAVSSERELARAHGVSLMTARSALTGLERQGIVERRRGAGTFVAVPKVNYNELVSTTELMAARGFSVTSRVLVARIVEDQPEIAARLGITGNSTLVKLERLRQVEQEPLALETSYLAASKFAELAAKPLERGSLFITLQNRYQTQLAYADEEVDATVADRRAASLLRVSDGAPVLRIRQVIYSTQGQPILYVLGLYRSDRHKLLIRRLRR